jgi:hypothetical protein
LGVGLRAGEGVIDYFLCAELDDKDLPWNINEIDY